jgi:hypothetical protein
MMEDAKIKDRNGRNGAKVLPNRTGSGKLCLSP